MNMKKNVKHLSVKKIISCLILLMVVFLATGCGQKPTEVHVDGIEISKKNLYLAEGQTAVISAQVYPFNANNQEYTFESSNTNVVTIEDGFVTAKKAGTATIYVYSTEGGYNDRCNVLVTTAGDNLELNQYNNMNMPSKELEPVYYDKLTQRNNTVKISQKLPNIKQTSAQTKPTLKDHIKNGIKKVNAEITENVDAGKRVLDDFKQDLKNSVDFLQEQKQSTTAMFETMLTGTQDSFMQSIKNFQTKMYDEMQTFQQNIMQSIENAKQKIDSEEYTVESGDINGVTFVVIKNAEN